MSIKKSKTALLSEIKNLKIRLDAQEKLNADITKNANNLLESVKKLQNDKLILEREQRINLSEICELRQMLVHAKKLIIGDF